jgi:hypothetical protein
VVGRHTAGLALRSDGVQGSAVRVRGKGGKQTNSGRKTFIYTIYKGTTWWKRKPSGMVSVTWGMSSAWANVRGGEVDKGPFVLTVGPGTPNGLDERDDLVRSLGERTGRKQGMSGMTWFTH